MAYKMHLPLGTGYPRGSAFICHTAKVPMSLPFRVLSNGGREASTPKNRTVYSTNYHREGPN